MKVGDLFGLWCWCTENIVDVDYVSDDTYLWCVHSL